METITGFRFDLKIGSCSVINQIVFFLRVSHF